MRLISQTEVDEYLKDDWILRLLEEVGRPGDEQLAVQQWLAQTPAKRMAFSALYGDILGLTSRRRVLDVGGGITALTRVLAQSNDYYVLDILSHGGQEVADELEAELGRPVLIKADWLSHARATDGQYDVIIANDIFPNADQRLELFLKTYLPRTHELRMSLTFYNEPRFYLCRRVDGDEFLCMLAWDGRQTGYVLRDRVQAIVEPDFSILNESGSSVFANGRHVCLVTMIGDSGA